MQHGRIIPGCYEKAWPEFPLPSGNKKRERERDCMGGRGEMSLGWTGSRCKADTGY